MSTRRPAKSRSAAGGSLAHPTLTPSPSQLSSSREIFSGARRSRAVPSAFNTACPNASGERSTSPPRILNNQAIEGGRRQQRRSGAALAQRCSGDPHSLGLRGLACICQVVGYHRCHGLGRTVLPRLIQRIGVRGLENVVAFAYCGLERLEFRRAVQPRVVADDPARSRLLLQIGRDAVIDQVAVSNTPYPLDRAPAGCSGHRRRSPPRRRITAAPAEPVKPVAQARRSLHAGKYSF